MSNNWQKEVPKKEGYYWFYGYIFDDTFEQRLEIVRVLKVSNGILYALGSSIIEVHNSDGFWQQITIPELP